MSKSLIKDENYVNIQGWMTTKLKLSGNELIIFAIIYGFSQIKGSKFTGSLGYLAEWINGSKQTCINNLKSLQEKQYIIKIEKEINGLKFCEYAVDFNTIQKILTPIQKILTPIQKTLPNNIDNNITNNIEDTNIINNICIDNVKNEKPKTSKKESKTDLVMQENIKCIIDYLNESIGSNYKYNSKQTIKDITARFKDGFVLDDFYDVIDKKVKEWFNTEMQQYLRPSTLFGTKFEQYLNQLPPKFGGTITSKYSSKPKFDNTADYTPPKGVASMTNEEKEKFYNTELARDKDGNFLKF